MNVRIHFLMIGLLQPFFIGHNEPAAHGGKLTGRAVNPHDNVGTSTSSSISRLFIGVLPFEIQFYEEVSLLDL